MPGYGNPQNRLTSVTVGGQVTQFLYDPDGNLVKKIKPDGSKTLYIGGIYEVDKTSGGTVTGTKTYYPAAGAMRIGSTLYYVIKDHLGSASVLTDASGNPVTGADTRYYPFGEARFSTAPMLTDKLFTGQREITGLGIYHYGARFYSPKLGRFLSADSIVPGYTNPQNLNRFSYVLNNPLKYTDPTGHWADDGYVGNHGSMNCNKYSQYCNNGKKKSAEELKNMRPMPPKKTKEEPWRISTTITSGLHLGPTAQIHAPNYDDDGYNGLPWRSGPYNSDNNFFVSINVGYDESVGINMSDIQYANQYSGPAVLESVRINNRIVHQGSSYMPADGSYRPILGTGGVYNGNDRISISIDVSYLVNLGHGPAFVPNILNTTLFSLPEVKHAMLTGDLLPSLVTP